jgi:hypothetical protein
MPWERCLLPVICNTPIGRGVCIAAPAGAARYTTIHMSAGAPFCAKLAMSRAISSNVQI